MRAIDRKWRALYYGLTKEKKSMEEIWYACYGSNINIGRFMKYIEKCDNKQPPVQEKRYEFPYNMYFAGISKRWDGKAVAFLDDSKPGHAYGKIYQISLSQFEQIKELEGEAYKKVLYLGEVEKIPVYTFTAPEKRTDLGIPSADYFDTILKGLERLYEEKSSEELEEYLRLSVKDERLSENG